MTDNRTGHRIDSLPLPLSLIYQHPFVSYRKCLFIHSFPYFITKIRREKFERKKRQFPKKLKARTLKKKPPSHNTQLKKKTAMIFYALLLRHILEYLTLHLSFLFATIYARAPKKIPRF
jgi:hypothetical protein